MKTAKLLKPGISGAQIGAVVAGVAGFPPGGRMVGSSAEKTAAPPRDELVAAPLPVSMEMSRSVTDLSAKLAALQVATPDHRRDVPMLSIWAPVAGLMTADRNPAGACVAELRPDAS